MIEHDVNRQWAKGRKSYNPVIPFATKMAESIRWWSEAIRSNIPLQVRQTVTGNTYLWVKEILANQANS